MSVRALVVSSLFVALLAVVPASTATGASMLKLKVTPKSPYADEAITVSWKTNRKLREGQHYQGTLVAGTGDDCAGLADVATYSASKKGKVARITFRPSDAWINDDRDWCNGRASISVTVATGGSAGNGKLLGLADFRIREKP